MAFATPRAKTSKSSKSSGYTSSSKSTTYKTSSGKTGVVRKGSAAEAKYKSQGASFDDSKSALGSARSASNAKFTAANRAARSTPGGIDNPTDRGTNETQYPAGIDPQTGLPPQAPNLPQNALGANAPVSAGVGATNPATAPVATPAASPTPKQNQYQTGLATLQGSGTPAPANPGAARSAVSGALPPQQEEVSLMDSFISDDPSINALMQGIGQLLNPPKQTSTLMQDYKSLYRQSGLKEINEELIDADTVINGTETDIRNEIQTAGGFGTESQVQAMSLARNKNLLKRYNQLVQMKTDATNQLNTLMSLNAQDKQMAQEKINQNINTMFQMANFRQQAVNNAKESYRWSFEQDPSGFYNSLASDPRQLGFAEKIMGVGPGGLQKLATAKAAEKSLDTQYKIAQINAANRSNQPSPAESQIINLGGGISLSPYGEKLTNAEIGKVRQAVQARNMIDQLRESYYRSNAGEADRGGLSGRLQGFGRVLGAAAGINETYREYQNLYTSNLSTIAKGMKSESGVLTNQDIARAKKTLPTAYSSPQEAEAAFREAYRQIDDTLGTFGDVVIDLE